MSILGIADLKNVAHESTISDWTEALHICRLLPLTLCRRYIYKLLPLISGNIGHAKKENALAVQGTPRANILRIQMLSADWRQVGQNLPSV